MRREHEEQEKPVGRAAVPAHSRHLPTGIVWPQDAGSPPHNVLRGAGAEQSLPVTQSRQLGLGLVPRSQMPAEREDEPPPLLMVKAQGCADLLCTPALPSQHWQHQPN